MGVSRSPPQEALPRLEAEGIVVLNPRRGYSVATLNPEIIEAFDLRCLLELNWNVSRTARYGGYPQCTGWSATWRNEPPWPRRLIAGNAFRLNTQFHNALLMPAVLSAPYARFRLRVA